MYKTIIPIEFIGGTDDITLVSSTSFNIPYPDMSLSFYSGGDSSWVNYCTLIGSSGIKVVPGSNSLKKLLADIGHSGPSKRTSTHTINSSTEFRAEARFVINSSTPRCKCEADSSLTDILESKFFISTSYNTYQCTKTTTVEPYNISSGGGFTSTLTFTATEKIFKNQRTFKVVSLIEALCERLGNNIPDDIVEVRWGNSYGGSPRINLISY